MYLPPGDLLVGSDCCTRLTVCQGQTDRLTDRQAKGHQEGGWVSYQGSQAKLERTGGGGEGGQCGSGEPAWAGTDREVRQEGGVN